MKKIEIKEEKSPITELTVNDKKDGFSVKFRQSGRTYSFNESVCRDNILTQFRNLDAGGNAIDCREKLLAAVNERLSEEQADSKYKVLLDNVRVSLYEKDENDFSGALSNENAFETVKSQLQPIFADGDVAQDVAWSVFDRFSETPYDQFMKPLYADFVKVKTDDPAHAIMYFYTRHRRSGMAEIWYKAVDPIAWYGKAEQQKR